MSIGPCAAHVSCLSLHLDLADIDIIKYDPRELAKPPYRLKVHSISPVFAKQVCSGCPQELTAKVVGMAACRYFLKCDSAGLLSHLPQCSVLTPAVHCIGMLINPHPHQASHLPVQHRAYVGLERCGDFPHALPSPSTAALVHQRCIS